jgi:hypothetical protein
MTDDADGQHLKKKAHILVEHRQAAANAPACCGSGRSAAACGIGNSA